MSEHIEAAEELRPKKKRVKGGRDKENLHAWQKAWRQKNLEKARAKDRARYQKDKEKRLKATGEYAKRNILKTREYKRNWKLRNPKKTREANQRFWKSENRKKQQAQYRQRPEVKLRSIHKEHRRRAAKLNCERPATALQLTALKQSVRNCYYCGVEHPKMHFEHMIPLVRGGSHAIENIVMSCPTCNLTKHDKTPEEFARYLAKRC